MKKFFKENSTQIYTYSLIGMICVAIYFFFSKFAQFANIMGFVISMLAPFITGFVIAYILNSAVTKVEKWLKSLNEFLATNRVCKAVFTKNRKTPKEQNSDSKICRGFAVFFVYIIVTLLLTLLTTMLIPQIKESIVTLVDNIPTYIASFRVLVNRIMTSLDLEISVVNQQKVYDTFFNYGTAIAEAFLNWAVTMPKALSSGFTTAVVGIIISIYFLFDKEHFFDITKKAFFVLFGEKTAKKAIFLASETDKYFSKFIIGKLIDSLIIGVLAFPFMIIIYRPYALLISAFIGITNIIPFFGPIVGAIPGAFIILILAPQKLIWYLIFVLALQQFDGNILGPKILGDKTGLSPVGVMFGILIGGKLFGFVGMIIGVPFTAVICSLLGDIIDLKFKKMHESELLPHE